MRWLDDSRHPHAIHSDDQDDVRFFSGSEHDCVNCLKVQQTFTALAGDVPVSIVVGTGAPGSPSRPGPAPGPDPEVINALRDLADLGEIPTDENHFLTAAEDVTCASAH